MEYDEMIKKLTDYYKENHDDFSHDIENLDDYDGCLGVERRRPMRELDDALSDMSPSDILLSAFNGGNDYGDAFNPKCHYFYGSFYTGLHSTNDRNYASYLCDDTIWDIISHAKVISLSEGAKAIINGQDND